MKKKANKKLILNKATISQLSGNYNMKAIYGGSVGDRGCRSAVACSVKNSCYSDCNAIRFPNTQNFITQVINPSFEHPALKLYLTFYFERSFNP